MAFNQKKERRRIMKRYRLVMVTALLLLVIPVSMVMAGGQKAER
jgi:heme/copper-type cytochrome/quinol oxidase subunit 4